MRDTMANVATDEQLVIDEELPAQPPAAARRPDLLRLRRFYAQALVESEDASQRMWSVGYGVSAAMMLLTLPLLGPLWSSVWLGAWTAAAAVGLATRRKSMSNLRRTLLTHMLGRVAPLDLEIWHRLAELKQVPAPLDAYIEHFLATYIDFKRQVRQDDKVELGQVQLLQAKDQVLDFLDLAERTGAIKHILDTMSHRISDEDQIRLRQRFSEQCAGLQEIAQSFDRGLGNLVVAQVLGHELGETTMASVQQRMRSIEDEFAEVKDSLSEHVDG